MLLHQPVGFDDDVAFANWLPRESVSQVARSSSLTRELGRNLIRFTFCKTPDLLDEAGARLGRMRELARARMNG